MKRIKQTTLHYQDDRSDKIYEVDLLSAGDNGYIVNFRYGRRGSNLKEGTKTSKPVSLKEAEKLFDKLVREKTKKGYQDIKATAPSSATPTGGEMTREERILSYLQGNPPENWPLNRIIWRAGELKLTAATPHLIALLGTEDGLRDYCIVYALGQCGSQEALPILHGLQANPLTPEFVCRMVVEVMWKLGDDSTQQRLQQQVCDRLPPILQEAISTANPDNFNHALQLYLNTENHQHFQVLDSVYQTHLDITRPALLQFIRTAPFAPPTFKPLRHLFKMAEYRQDREVFGALVRRLEKEQGMYDTNRYYLRLSDGTYLYRYQRKYNRETRRYEIIRDNFKEEQQRPDTRLAYSQQTRNYLRRRVWRNLRKLGEENDIAYVDLAVGILLEYTDADAQQPKETIYYRYDSNWRRITFTNLWDKYASYLIFNHILYSHSPRYSLNVNSQAWGCQKGYQPGDPQPEEREEAFPQLWNQRPDALLELLLNSQCHPVHQFAIRALQECRDFWVQIQIQDLIRLLSQPYDETTEFGLTLAREQYTPKTPQVELVLALLNCTFSPARSQAHQWIEDAASVFLASTEWLLQVLLSPYLDTQEFARQFLRSHSLPEDTAKLIIGQVIAELNSRTDGTSIDEISETLLTVFPTALQTISLSALLDLIQHPVAELQTLGARLLLNHQTPATELPATLIESLMTSEQESIRHIGVELFGQLGDRQLRENYRDAIIAMALNAIPDLRQSIQPIIARLANGHPQFSIQLATELLQFLLAPEPHQGVHKDLLILLRDNLPEWKANISAEMVLQLLKSNLSSAQELGGILLQANPNQWAKQWSTAEIVRLASHEILSIRQASWTMMENIIDRIRPSTSEKLAAVRILEAKWEDSRQFARDLFQGNFTDADWTPEVMILVCDSIREDVRDFGRELVIRTFTEPYGQDYLLKFSEHPSTDMQAFASGYLQNYATDNPERLVELKPYLITVLSQVNRGRVAKQNVFQFLEQEALKSEAAAEVISQVLTRQSATMAIADKAQCLQLMLRLHKHYPHIDLPIQVKPVTEIRH